MSETAVSEPDALDLVVVSLERWDAVWRRNQYLIDGLLRELPGLRVLFVEPPDDPLHALRRGARPEFGHGVRRIADRLWTLRPVKLFPRRIDRSADRRLAQAVIAAAGQLRMRHPVLWVNDPAAADAARLSGWPTLYDMTDDWLSADRPGAEHERIARGEAWLLANAAAVVACSAELAERKAAQRSDIAIVRNGVDTAAYRTRRSRPADLPVGAVAMYLGTLHRDRLDVELCIETARGLGEDATLVLVGPNALSGADTSALRDAGAHVLGPRPRDEVIGYLQHADVLLVPHLVTDFTESLDPIKLYEYLAAGPRIVSTPVAGFRDAEDPRIHVAERSAFAAAVLAAVLEELARNPEAADSDALPREEHDWSAHDWAARVRAMAEILTAL